MRSTARWGSERLIFVLIGVVRPLWIAVPVPVGVIGPGLVTALLVTLLSLLTTLFILLTLLLSPAPCALPLVF